MADATRITLRPGEIWFGGGHHSIHTLLGSCVAVTIWHPGKKLGGMCHYLLSQGEKKAAADERPGRYATDAIAWFAEQVRKHQTRPEEYEVKMFGGGNMFPTIIKQTRSPSVAQANVMSGIAILKQHGFLIQARDVGGIRYRTLFLELWSGDVWVKYGPEKREN